MTSYAKSYKASDLEVEPFHTAKTVMAEAA